MELPTYFNDFLQEIRLSDRQKDDLITGHRTLRDRLHDDKALKPIIVDTFLQGSYRRATAVRPKNDQRSDVDVILVTKLHEDEYKPDEAFALFTPFLDTFYKNKYRIQGRSIGIELTYVELDLVITSAPSEREIGLMEASNLFEEEDTLEEILPSEEVSELAKSWFAGRSWTQQNAYVQLQEMVRSAQWKLSPLSIPNRDANNWEPTHPLAQIQWTWNKNKLCNRHYVNVVKAIKWWKKIKYPDFKHPKGYPLEHLIGQCCPDGITSVAEGITLSLENIVTNYQYYADSQQVPFLGDHGVQSHNVLGRLSGIDFANFHSQVATIASIARRAYESKDKAESINLWQEILGNKFPDDPEDNNKSSEGFTSRKDKGPSIIGDGRFA